MKLLPLTKFVFLTVIAISTSTSLAMGEGERAMNWLFNTQSDGTYMAELDAQRAIIEQQYNNEFLHEKVAMQNETKANTIERLNGNISQLDGWLISEKKLSENCEAAQGGLDAVMDAVQTLRVSNADQTLKIEELAQTFRQEADINGIDASSIAELADICTRYETQYQHSLPVCRLIALFNTQDYAKLTEINPDTIHAQLDTLGKHAGVQARICKNISMQISVFQSRRDAASARLQFLEGKK